MNGEIPFDAITTLFVFLIGVPAIVLQSMPPEVRRVVTKRRGRLLVEGGVPLAVAVAVTGGGIALAPNAAWDPGRTWIGVLALLFLIGSGTAFRFMAGYGRRNAVVLRLEDEIGRAIPRTGRPVEDSLHDLIELGQASEPGREKEWVLESLLRLTERVCGHREYLGDALEDVLMGALAIVLTGSQRRNAQNFTTATRVLRCVVMAYERVDHPPARQADLIHAIRALSRLGRASLVLEDAGYALAAVQALGRTRLPRGDVSVSQALFEVGVEAVEREQMLIAISCLERLMTLVEARKPARGELVADTLGLLAHFWHSGQTGREYARLRLERTREYLETDLESALESAASHCAQTMQFRTADLVRAIRS
jgi:hypothetical protein